MTDIPDPSPVLLQVSISKDDFWTILAVLAFALFVVLLFVGVLYRHRDDRPEWLNRLQKWQNREETNSGLFLAICVLSVAGAAIWAALLSVLVSGLFGLLMSVLDLAPPHTKDEQTAFRFLLAKIAGLTAVSGAVLALPFTVIRLRLTQQQTDTARAALFNSKITEAAADLHATRQVSKKVGKNKWESIWEDDVVRRNAAIDRLEGLVREEPAEAGRVSRLLSVYVRELSKEFPAQKAPDTDDITKLYDWAQSLTIARSDMENAVQVLGRLAGHDRVDQADLAVDLRAANLQAMDLHSLNFDKAQLQEAKLQGAILSLAKLQGALLWQAQFDPATILTTATFQGAAVKMVDYTDIPQILAHLDDLFGDGSTKLPDGTHWPEHWPKDTLKWGDFDTQWRAWAKTKGIDIPE